ncbi:MAG: hypothetical protein GPJ54_10335 [Candidatus Heimdallarchaeota archaeon]|nr:hypothetical protein [Candidatus Heimdallarchaeota archaeon]
MEKGIYKLLQGKNDKAAGIELAYKSSEILGRYITDVTLITFEGGHQFPPSDLIAKIADWVIE